MLKVLKSNHDEYIVLKDNKAHAGNLIKTVTVLDHYNVAIGEIEMGLTELEKHNHNCAEYGIGLGDGRPKFLFTKSVVS